MATQLKRERPDTGEARKLIAELEAELNPLYDAQSRHGYSVEKLLQRGVSFYVLRVDEAPAGCCGIEFFGTAYGELKRMYVRPPFRGRGLGVIMLDHLAAVARQHGIGLLRLETGIHQAAAIGLYEQYGFRGIGPFGDYRADPSSFFYELDLYDRDS